MNRGIKIDLIGLTVLGLSAPSARFASNVKAAQAAGRPLVVYRFVALGIAPRVYTGAQKYQAYAGLQFINTAQKPIQKIVFKVSDYRSSQPIVGDDRRPVEGDMVATGPFAAGGSYTVISNTPLWTRTTLPLASNCPRVTGIQVLYQDGSGASASPQGVSKYLTPQININCAYRYAYDGFGINGVEGSDYSAPGTHEK